MSMPMMFRPIVFAITAAIVLVTGAATAAPAAAAECTKPNGDSGVYVWIKSPTTIGPDGEPGGTTRAAGTRLCKAADEFVTSAYVEGAVGWILVTKRAPNLGGPAGSAGRAHADAAKALAAKYGVALQFAAADEVGRVGYVTSSGAMLTGNYSPGGVRGPGKGLIRLGNGGDNMSAAGSGNNWFRKYLLNVARHEIAHSEIEQRCGTTKPPVAGGPSTLRSSTGKAVYEHVTDAYAVMYLGATSASPGGYGYSKALDAPRAQAIHAGDCG